RRTARRVIVGPEHTVRFQVKGHVFRNVRITNLSDQGCFAMVNQGHVALFVQGTPLEDFAFEHPDLALGPIVARVRYVLGGTGDATFEFMGVGIHFAGMDEASARTLAEFLARMA
ncbi:MAG TPA: PilZ domain-containing protein, partial [Holophaga sp.]|nr:PilZ domain-containing protein [Holophaga sp.]